MEGRLLLYVIVRESAAVFELLAGEDQALLVGRDAFLVWNDTLVSRKLDVHDMSMLALDLGLDIIDGIG